jgi:predicted nucleotidyltransferase
MMQIDAYHPQLRDFCERWMIEEFAFFGSVLRDDFGADSDVDVLVRFAENAPWSSFELAEMRDELTDIFGREVDLVEEAAVRNPYRKASIQASKSVVYAS